jgi:hypothetical protein
MVYVVSYLVPDNGLRQRKKSLMSGSDQRTLEASKKNTFLILASLCVFYKRSHRNRGRNMDIYVRNRRSLHLCVWGPMLYFKKIAKKAAKNCIFDSKYY